MNTDTTAQIGYQPSETVQSRRDSLVIIPTYNEAGNLGPLVRQILAMDVFDVLVVDDHSPDGTGQLADALATEFPGRVVVHHRSGKLGLGTAYIQGFTYALHAGYECIFQMDADFSHDPGRLPALRQSLDTAEVVLGSRYVRGGTILHWPLRRRILSRAGSIYSAMVLGLPLRDVTSGFKGFNRHVLQRLDLDTIRSSGFSFQIEVTYRCYQHGFHIVEVPISFEDRQVGQSKMDGHIVTEALWMVWRLRIDQLRHRRMLPWSDPSAAVH